MVTERAPSARDSSPPPEAPQTIVRLHHQVVEDPAPRRSLTPAQALHLAREGPSGGRQRRHAAAPSNPEVEIVLPEAQGVGGAAESVVDGDR